MALIILKVFQHVYNIHLEGTVSQNFKISLSFIFMSKKREDFHYSFIFIFLDFIKKNLGHVSKI